MSFDELQKKTAIVIALFSITTLVFMLHHTLMKQFAIAEVAYAKEDALCSDRERGGYQKVAV